MDFFSILLNTDPHALLRRLRRIRKKSRCRCIVTFNTSGVVGGRMPRATGIRTSCRAKRAKLPDRLAELYPKVREYVSLTDSQLGDLTMSGKMKTGSSIE